VHITIEKLSNVDPENLNSEWTDETLYLLKDWNVWSRLKHANHIKASAKREWWHNFMLIWIGLASLVSATLAGVEFGSTWKGVKMGIFCVSLSAGAVSYLMNELDYQRKAALGLNIACLYWQISQTISILLASRRTVDPEDTVALLDAEIKRVIKEDNLYVDDISGPEYTTPPHISTHIHPRTMNRSSRALERLPLANLQDTKPESKPASHFIDMSVQTLPELLPEILETSENLDLTPVGVEKDLDMTEDQLKSELKDIEAQIDTLEVRKTPLRVRPSLPIPSVPLLRSRLKDNKVIITTPRR
jgi:hypothetical protein